MNRVAFTQALFPGRAKHATLASTLVMALALAGLGIQPISAQSLVLNELQAANSTTIVDPDFGEASDWVELFNPSGGPIELGGYRLTDDPAQPEKWLLPAGTMIAAGAYLLVWADGRDTGLHASFALDRAGEWVGLFDPAGVLVDSVSFGEMATDVSFGREAATGTSWAFFLQPTPGGANQGDVVSGFSNPPVLSPIAGFYASGKQVAMTSSDGLVSVRFTTDGSLPTAESDLYAGPIALSESTVFRAVAFRSGFAPSSVATSTYFINEAPTLPVVSLSTDPANFFDDRRGIYVRGTNGITGNCKSTPHNWNQDWERPVHIELFEPEGQMGFSQDATVKIFGGCTRIYDQKSLAIFTRSNVGPGKIRYRIFPNLDFDSYNNLVLRSSAQDWWRTMFRDGMIQTLIAQGMAIDTQAYRPALVFLNGQYWGIHNLREKLNEHYFAAHFGLDPEHVEILQNDKDPINGISGHFDEMMAFIRSPDIMNAGALEVVSQWMDVDAYLDYQVAEIYSANADWPGNNLKLWRPRTADGRWRWAIFDMDMGFGGNSHGTTGTNSLELATSTANELWSNPPWSTEQLRRLLLNDQFRDSFIQRMAAHISTTFEPQHVLQVIDSLKQNIAAEIPRHMTRWSRSISFGSTWDSTIKIMRDFARDRPAAIRGHFNQRFLLAGSARLNLEISDPGSGTIEAAGVKMHLGSPGPVFFRNAPLMLKAIPEPGYRFVGWEGDRVGSTDTLAVTLTGQTSMMAVFVPAAVATVDEITFPVISRLGQSYPNPVARTARVEFDLTARSWVSIRLFDLLGRHVLTISNKEYEPGRHSVTFPVDSLQPGIYAYRMESTGFRATRLMTVLR